MHLTTESLWGKTAKIVAQLPSSEIENYFLKVRTMNIESFARLNRVSGSDTGRNWAPYVRRGV